MENNKRPSRRPLCDITSGCGFFTGPWTVTRASLRMLRRVNVFCRLLQPVLLLVFASRSRSRSAVVGVPGLCWLRRVPFVPPRISHGLEPPPPPLLPFALDRGLCIYRIPLLCFGCVSRV